MLSLSQSVAYVCKEGTVPDDQSLFPYELECGANNAFQTVTTWPVCVESEFSLLADMFDYLGYHTQLDTKKEIRRAMLKVGKLNTNNNHAKHQ